MEDIADIFPDYLLLPAKDPYTIASVHPEAFLHLFGDFVIFFGDYVMVVFGDYMTVVFGDYVIVVFGNYVNVAFGDYVRVVFDD